MLNWALLTVVAVTERHDTALTCGPIALVIVQLLVTVRVAHAAPVTRSARSEHIVATR